MFLKKKDTFFNKLCFPKEKKKQCGHIFYILNNILLLASLLVSCLKRSV